ncbi:hypothetical protein [Helicobacter sp. L8]|uniref:hypothetical protein n=1 Tax=Helicobacter sp. L8 TaxID=2316078 RepID=UPI000EAEAD9B|nr:hypothetical protein [Helicobacter sp. L8]
MSNCHKRYTGILIIINFLSNRSRSIAFLLTRLKDKGVANTTKALEANPAKNATPMPMQRADY